MMHKGVGVMKYDKPSEPQGVDPTWLDAHVAEWDTTLIAALIAKAGYVASWQWGNTLER